MPVVFALGLVVLLGPAGSVFQATPAEFEVPGVAPDRIPSGAVGEAASLSHTVYTDRSGGNMNSAVHMNALRQVMAANGWTFVEPVPHEESDDLEGWWITHTAR